MKKKHLPHKEEEVIQLAAEGLIKGYKASELSLEIKQKLPEENEELIEIGIRKAMTMIKEQTLIDIDKILPQHVELYEKIYKRFDELRYVPGKLKALRGKEKLIGLHKEANYVEVYNEVNIEITTDVQYDPSHLNVKEQKRLSDLMKKCEINASKD